MNVKLSEKHKIKILNSEDIFSVMREILLREDKIGRNKEHLWIVGLAKNNRVLFIELLALGSGNIAFIDPPDVFRMAIYKLAAKAILVHNHPNEDEDIVPTDKDKDCTDHFIQIGKILKIDVIDHLIISPNTYFSFADDGLMEQLRKSKKYVVPYIEEQRILKEQAKIRKQAVKDAEEKAISKRNLQIAKGLKKDGIAIEIIAKNTGLSQAEIEKIK